MSKFLPARFTASKFAVPLISKILMVFILGINVVYADGVLSNKKTTKPNTQNSSQVINQGAAPNSAPTSLPVLQKQAVSVSNASNGGYTVDWVVQYANTSGQTLTNATIKDGAISTIVNGTLQQPAGWTGALSAGNTMATWTGVSVPPFGVMTAPIVSSAGGTVTVSGSGDGFQPIPFVHSTGRRIYIMNHHAYPGASSFDCVIPDTGAHCNGWPRKLPFGDNSANYSGTTGNNKEYVINGSKFYYSAQNFSTWGIGCFDLESETQCGFTQLGTSSNKATQTTLQGPWQVGNELYFADYDGQMYCAQLSAGMPSCLSSYKIPLSNIKINTASRSGATDAKILDWSNGLIAAKAIGKKLYITSRAIWYQDNSATNPKYINCLDTVTKLSCWATTVPSKGTGLNTYSDPYALNYSNFVYYNSSGTAVALCTKSDITPFQFCSDLNTGVAVLLPRIFSSHADRNTLSVDGYPRSYFAGVGTGNGAGWCWDWSTGNYCNGVVGSFSVPNGSYGEYGNNIDDRGCIWTYGHEHFLWSYDPSNIDKVKNKALPCGGSGKFTQTFQPLKYCSGPKPFHWLSVAVTGAPITNYTKFIVKVLNSTNNAVLLTQDFMPAGPMTVDISSLDAQTLSQPLKIEVEYTPKPNVNDKPILEVHYDGPPMEFCFKSEHKCDQGKITNNVSTEFDPNQNARTTFGRSTKVKLFTATADVEKPQSCPAVACGTAAGQLACPLCDCLGNAVPVCGTPGQPPCPKCGQAGQPSCQVCGQAGQPPCVTCDVPPTNGNGTPKKSKLPQSSSSNSSIFK
jgi:hypothetical protein